MTRDEAQVGVRVKTTVAFGRLPKGSEGVIDQDYGSGVMVAWDGPPGFNRLPPGYRRWDGVWFWASGILRDGFDKEMELRFLEAVR